MRVLFVLPLLIAAAACGGSGSENKAAPAAATVAQGQWELTSQVTGFTALDHGAPSRSASAPATSFRPCSSPARISPAPSAIIMRATAW
jgi:hypothetical protein